MKRGHQKRKQIKKKKWREKGKRSKFFLKWNFFEQKQRDWDKRNKIFFKSEIENIQK